MKRAPFRWAPVAAYALVLFALSSLSHPPARASVLANDKVVHAIAFGGLALFGLLAAAASWPRWSTTRAAVTTWACVTLYGVSDEIHQLATPYRTADVRDALADAVGAALAVTVVGLALHAWRARRPADEALPTESA